MDSKQIFNCGKVWIKGIAASNPHPQEKGQSCNHRSEYEKEKMFNQSSRMRKQNGKEAKIKDMYFPGLLSNMNLDTGSPTYTKAYT